MTTDKGFRLSARAEQCAGSGGCAAAAPHLFARDTHGWVTVLNHHPPMRDLDAALDAHDACPLGLIDVLDDQGNSLA